MDILELGTKLAIYFVPFLFALCFHEFAHGWVARLRGDRTAEIMGRLTLNPIPHMDPIGTLVMPIMAIVTQFPFFGWAKPVPVNERNLKNPRTDMFWIALAGPLSNVLLAVVGTGVMALVMRFVDAGTGKALVTILVAFVQVNLFLAFFNLIPVHPLDGGKVLARFLPYEANRWMEENQQMLSLVLMMLFFVGGMRFLAIPVMHLAEFMFSLAGLR